MKIKKITFALLLAPIFSTAVFAEDFAAGEDVDNVKFDQHFKSNQSYMLEGESEIEASSNAAESVGKSGGTAVLLVTSASFLEAKYLGQIKKAMLTRSTKEVASLLKKANLNRKIALTGAVGSIYFIFDTASGVVVMMLDSRPVYAANAPALVSYVAREGVENVGQALNTGMKKLPEGAQKELENIKETILGQRKN